MPRESITLYYRNGSSDKVYQVSLEAQDEGFVVNFAYGRRGGTLHAGTKTSAPVPFEQAKKIYGKLVRSKTAKGYSPGGDGTPYAHTEKAGRDTGLRPQLLNPILEAEAQRYLADPRFWMQEKMDGRRVMLRKLGGEVTGINRSGLAIALPGTLLEQARAPKGSFVLDGEAVGEKFFAFDCLSRDDVNLAAHPYRDRWRVLMEVAGAPREAISVLPTAAAPGGKKDFYRLLRERNAEGVVFKDQRAPYTPGRPAKGGPQLKLKFYATASVIVAPGRKGKRSVGLELLDGARQIRAGNVAIPHNHAIPKSGQVIEVRYLYAYPGGALYQPVFLGVRDDVAPSACTVGQLKYRRPDAEDER